MHIKMMGQKYSWAQTLWDDTNPIMQVNSQGGIPFLFLM